MDIRIIGKPGSKAVKRLLNRTDLKRYNKKCEIVVNYGLAGARFKKFIDKHPSIMKKPIINRDVGHSKYRMIQIAEKNGILVPSSYISLPKTCKTSNFISKKFFSQGGLGIVKAKTKKMREGRYYQEFIKTRDYELRIHGFLWMDKPYWLTQKRFGKKDVIAWNYSKGGTFQTVNDPRAFTEAKDITDRILNLNRMSFGAVDFIVDNSGNLFFLEINSSPGFTELSEGYYVEAFNKLKKLNKKSILKYCN